MEFKGKGVPAGIYSDGSWGIYSSVGGLVNSKARGPVCSPPPAPLPARKELPSVGRGLRGPDEEIPGKQLENRAKNS